MSEYEMIIDNMRWSHSRLTSFERCKYEFYLNYIVDDNKQYLSESNFYAEVGIFVHDILARVFNKFTKDKNAPKLDVEEAAQYFVDNFDDNVFYKAKQSTVDKTFE